MIGKNELAEAARYNDADMGEDEGALLGWFSRRNIEAAELFYVANQRALRAVMTSFMGVKPEELNLPLSAPRQAVDMPEHLRALLPILAASVVDGVAMMARAREIEQRNLHEIIKDALEGDSNDAEHAALALAADYLGIDYEKR